MVANAQYTYAVAITASDTVNLDKPCDGIYVGGAGAVAVVLASGDAVTFAAVPVGTILPVYAKRVNATNTAASNLVALYR